MEQRPTTVREDAETKEYNTTGHGAEPWERVQEDADYFFGSGTEGPKQDADREKLMGQEQG